MRDALTNRYRFQLLACGPQCVPLKSVLLNKGSFQRVVNRTVAMTGDNALSSKFNIGLVLISPYRKRKVFLALDKHFTASFCVASREDISEI